LGVGDFGAFNNHPNESIFAKGDDGNFVVVNIDFIIECVGIWGYEADFTEALRILSLYRSAVVVHGGNAA